MNVRTCLACSRSPLPLLGAAIDPRGPGRRGLSLTATGDVGATDTGSNIGTALANKLVQLGGLTVKPFIAVRRGRSISRRRTRMARTIHHGLHHAARLRGFRGRASRLHAFGQHRLQYDGPCEDVRRCGRACRRAARSDLRHAGRGMGYLDAPPPSASPEPIANCRRRQYFESLRPPSQGRRHGSRLRATANGCGRGVSRRSARRARRTGRTKALVVTTAGTADATARSYASASLVSALRHAGLTNQPLMVSSAEHRSPRGRPV